MAERIRNVEINYEKLCCGESYGIYKATDAENFVTQKEKLKSKDLKDSRSYMYVGVAIAYYGLCRIHDLKKITTEDFYRKTNTEFRSL